MARFRVNFLLQHPARQKLFQLVFLCLEGPALGRRGRWPGVDSLERREDPVRGSVLGQSIQRFILLESHVLVALYQPTARQEQQRVEARAPDSHRDPISTDAGLRFDQSFGPSRGPDRMHKAADITTNTERQPGRTSSEASRSRPGSDALAPSKNALDVRTA